MFDGALKTSVGGAAGVDARLEGVEITVGDDPAEGAYEEYEPEPGPDLDEERLSILRMLEQGQIAPEEAEMLLDALQ